MYHIIFIQLDSALAPLPLTILICPTTDVANECCLDKRRYIKINKLTEVVTGKLVFIVSYPTTYAQRLGGVQW